MTESDLDGRAAGGGHRSGQLFVATFEVSEQGTQSRCAAVRTVGLFASIGFYNFGVLWGISISA